MTYLSLKQVIAIHRMVIERSGGDASIRDRGGLESAVAQPRMSGFGQEYYPTLAEKAAALAFSLIKNCKFVDGNKRTGIMAAIVFLALNDHFLYADVDETEPIVLGVVDGSVGRDPLLEWIRSHMVKRSAD